VLTLTDVITSDGGAERIAVTLPAALDPSRFESWICSTRGRAEPDAVARLEEAGVRVVTIERRGKLDLAAWKPLVSLLRRERIDVVHGHMFGSNVWAALLGRAARVPVVIGHEHSWPYVGRPVRRLLDRELIARFSDAFIAVSPEDRRRMIEIERIRPEWIRLIYNAVPDHEPSGADVRAELGIAPDAPVIGAVGAITAAKAYDYFVEVVAALRPRLPGLRVLIAGVGPPDEVAVLQAQIDGLGLTEVVTLLGRRDDVPDVLEALDVAVLASDSEGMPLALLEYMAAGKPTVATRVGGIPVLVDDGVHALLVERRDVGAMADAIALLLADRERAAALGAAAAERRRREFALPAMTQQFESLYEELFARTRRARAEGWSPA
jgi:glycosyltransferase involved in cell wall biosynthesis